MVYTFIVGKHQPAESNRFQLSTVGNDQEVLRFKYRKETQESNRMFTRRKKVIEKVRQEEETGGDGEGGSGEKLSKVAHKYTEEKRHERALHQHLPMFVPWHHYSYAASRFLSSDTALC